MPAQCNVLSLKIQLATASRSSLVLGEIPSSSKARSSVSLVFAHAHSGSVLVAGMRLKFMDAV